MIAGFERADAGSVAIGGRVVDDAELYVAPEHRGIGYVPQEGALFPHLSVGRNVAFGLPKSVRRSGVVGDLLELVGLRGWGRRYPHQLSGGQQQRVALARALAVRPAVVLLDEPFSSLDASLRATVRGDVREILRKAGTTALLVTHDQDEALSWADHVAVIREGRIGQFDTPQHLYEQPVDPGLARFFGDANLVPGVVEGSAVTTPLGRLTVSGPVPEPGTEAVVLVRPEQLELTRTPAGSPLTGVVVEYEYYGHDAVVRVRPDTPFGPETLVVRLTGGSAWTPGTPVGVANRGPVLAWPATGPAERAPQRSGAPGSAEITPP